MLVAQIGKNKIVEIVEDLLHALNKELNESEENAIICAHDANIKSMNLQRIGHCVDIEKMDDWMSELLWNDCYENYENEENKECAHKKMEIYRMKAVLPAKNGKNYFLSSVQ